MKKTPIKKIKKTKRKAYKSKKIKRILFAVGIGILFMCLCFCTVMFSPLKEIVTGRSVYVKYYGVSNYPLNSKAGKIQTYIKIKQPTLRNLGNSATIIETANDITEAADFANGLVSAYSGDPPAPVPTGALDAVIAGAKAATNHFKSQTTCLRKIGTTYKNSNEVKLVLVSELAYKQCSSYPDWSYAYAKHTYYTYSGGKYVCRQDGSKLFSIEMGTGKTSKSTWGC
ncbi:hypothetical protein ACFL0E_00550 [Nanoarchaeota archaeon]